jgi:hypothetical protein
MFTNVGLFLGENSNLFLKKTRNLQQKILLPKNSFWQNGEIHHKNRNKNH